MGNRLPIVGVIGSGRVAWESRAAPLGAWLAAQGVHLLTGGGEGVMASVSRTFFEVPGRRGLVLAVLPSRIDDPLCRPPAGYPNPWVEVPIATHLPLTGKHGCRPLSRNHILVLSSTLVIALPGGEGTLSEVRLAREYQRPLVAFLEHREELPGLPVEVPVAGTLPAVQAFVRMALRENSSTR